MSERSTKQVLRDHLEDREADALERDLERNYHPDVILLCEHGAYRGRDAVRKSGRSLAEQVPAARFDFSVIQIEGDYALLIWQAESKTDPGASAHGVDTFTIRDGKIVMQSVSYRLGTDG